jgi:hypothetical protein
MVKEIINKQRIITSLNGALDHISQLLDVYIQGQRIVKKYIKNYQNSQIEDKVKQFVEAKP